jgi:hypothetical protein
MALLSSRTEKYIFVGGPLKGPPKSQASSFIVLTLQNFQLVPSLSPYLILISSLSSSYSSLSLSQTLFRHGRVVVTDGSVASRQGVMVAEASRNAAKAMRGDSGSGGHPPPGSAWIQQGGRMSTAAAVGEWRWPCPAQIQWRWPFPTQITRRRLSPARIHAYPAVVA